MGDFDPNKHIGGATAPEFKPRWLAEPVPLSPEEYKRLSLIHANHCGGPFWRLTLPPKWAELYLELDSEAITESLYAAAKAWSKNQGLTWAPGTLRCWLDSEYSEWAKKQETGGKVADQEQVAAEARAVDKAATQARLDEENELLAEFHAAPDHEQKKCRDKADAAASQAERRFPVARVQEVNAAKLWKRKKG